ncbi:hypothetical protein Tco_1158738 [Tanacetum coccineum]
MTRSSTKELLLPFENLEQKFCSRRRLFDTPSLVESNSPEFDHNFDIEEQSEEEDKDEGKSHAETLIDIPVFVGSFSIISGFTIIDDDDMTKDVVLGMKFCKKYASCQMIMKKFTLGDKCQQIMEDE